MSARIPVLRMVQLKECPQLVHLARAAHDALDLFDDIGKLAVRQLAVHDTLVEDTSRPARDGVVCGRLAGYPSPRS
jgi:hypothetical protein